MALKLANSPLAPLRHRNYRLFWYGQLVSLTGTWVQSVAQGWLIVQLADPTGLHGRAAANWYLGVVGAAGSLPILFAAPLGGVVADRMDKRRLIIITQAMLMLSALTMAVLVATGAVRIWHVLALALMNGTTTAFDLPARQSFVIEMVGKEDLGGAVALNSGTFNAARTLGPAITGALLAARVSLAMCFLLNGLSFLAVLAGLVRMRLPVQRNASADGRVLEHMAEGLRFVRHAPTVRRLLILVGSFGAFAFAFNVLLPAFVRYTLVPGLPETAQGPAYGTLESTRGIGALFGAGTVAWLARRQMQRRLLVIGSVGSLAGLFAFSFTKSLPAAYAVMSVTAFCFVLTFSSCNTLVQLTVPDALRGRVMSLYVVLFTGTAPIGSLLAGSIARSMGAPTALRIGVILTVASVATGMLVESLLSRRKLPENLTG